MTTTKTPATAKTKTRAQILASARAALRKSIGKHVAGQVYLVWNEDHAIRTTEVQSEAIMLAARTGLPIKVVTPK